MFFFCVSSRLIVIYGCNAFVVALQDSWTWQILALGTVHCWSISGNAFGESLCLSQLLFVDDVLEGVQDMGWSMEIGSPTYEIEIANVKAEIQIM